MMTRFEFLEGRIHIFPSDLNFSRGVELPPDPPPYRAIATPNSGFSRSVHSLHREARSGTITPITPSFDAQVI